MINIQRLFISILILGVVLVGVFVFFGLRLGGITGGDIYATLPDATLIQHVPTVSPQKPTISVGPTQLMVKNFLANGETVADPVNAGNYILAGSLGYCTEDGVCPTAAAAEAFAVSYDEVHDVFTVVLLQEPVRDARRAAEAFLLGRLGVDVEELCVLNYYVTTPSYVNQFYAGVNLGFSSCPNAIVLE